MVLAWLGSQALSELGAALVGIGSILSLIALLGDEDKKRALPLAITFVAFGSVLTLAPAYEEAGSSAYWKVIAGIAGLTLCFSALAPIRWLIRRTKPFWMKPSHSEDKDREDQQKQPKGPVWTDVDTERHHSTLGASTLSAPEKSLANSPALIALGLVLLIEGMRLLLGRDRPGS